MKKLFFYLFALTMLVSCTSQKPLYTWESYGSHSYKYLKKRDKESRSELIESCQEVINNQEGEREMVPPGVYADYGFLLIKSGELEKGKKMLSKEMQNYPESEVFIERILKMIEQ